MITDRGGEDHKGGFRFQVPARFARVRRFQLSIVYCLLSVVCGLWSVVCGLWSIVYCLLLNLQDWMLQMKIGGFLVAPSQGQDFSLGIEFPHKGHTAGSTVFGEAVGQHHRRMTRHIR